MGSLELAPRGSTSVQDRAAAFAGQALLGVELLWPGGIPRRKARPITGGLTIEGGYGFSSPLGFDLAPEGDGDLNRIPLLGTEVGSVSLNGPQVRIGVLIHF